MGAGNALTQDAKQTSGQEHRTLFKHELLLGALIKLL